MSQNYIFGKNNLKVFSHLLDFDFQNIFCNLSSLYFDLYKKSDAIFDIAPIGHQVCSSLDQSTATANRIDLQIL